MDRLRHGGCSFIKGEVLGVWRIVGVDRSVEILEVWRIVGIKWGGRVGKLIGWKA